MSGNKQRALWYVMGFSVAVNFKALTGQILVFSINGHWKEAVAYERWYIV